MGKKVLVIGGGPGGYVAAIRAAQLGAKVTLVEHQYLGGTCLNVGCIPTKCLLHSAELMMDIQSQGPQMGILADNIRVDFTQVMAHKRAVSQQLSSGVAGLLKMNGVTVINGTARFTAPKTVEITGADGTVFVSDADGVIIATGSVNFAPPIPGIKENQNCLDSTDVLSLETLPKSMVIIGAGVIGLEIACAYAAFGTQITVVEALDHILPMLDSDLTSIGLKHLKRMGIKVNMQMPVQAVEETTNGVSVLCKDKKGNPVSFEAEKVLVAVGRRANTATLGLEQGGICSNRSAICVNDRMETSVPGIYAIGDCVEGYAQLAHTASLMGEIAAENIMDMDVTYNESTCPTCVYIEPEAASVGLTEAQCKDRGIAVQIGKFPMAGNGKALILNGGEGIVKILADKVTAKVIGMHIIGPRATDLISEGALAIRTGATLEDLIQTIHSHPTVTEAVREAALSAENRAIHIPNTR